MNTLKELAALLDAATGPSRELDARLWWAFADHSEDDHDLDGEPLWVMTKLWGGSPSSWTWIPQFTSSIDAALALAERLLPGWGWQINSGSYAILRPPKATCWSSSLCFDGDSPTAPLAILKALVAALIVQETTDE
jgi:hypothetical protein